MPRPYTRKPCRRCGGEKEPRTHRSHMLYCAPCAVESRRDHWRQHKPWWCGSCDLLWSCKACAAKKHERALWVAQNRKPSSRSKSSYFRPFHAEKWWQSRCHSAVQAAIKRGVLPRLKDGGYACVDCGGVALEYDHRDYSRPYDVEPVCRSCNKQRGTAKWPTVQMFAFRRLDEQKAA